MNPSGLNLVVNFSKEFFFHHPYPYYKLSTLFYNSINLSLLLSTRRFCIHDRTQKKEQVCKGHKGAECDEFIQDMVRVKSCRATEVELFGHQCTGEGRSRDHWDGPQK